MEGMKGGRAEKSQEVPEAVQSKMVAVDEGAALEVESAMHGQ